jgi:anti-sigma factor RsiW
MTCRQLTPDIVDMARGEALDLSREAAALRHLRECASCAARLDKQRAMSVALRRLAAERVRPSGDQNEDERVLLAAFDAARAQPRRVGTSVRLPLAATVVIAAGLSMGWMYERNARLQLPTAPVAPLAVVPLAVVRPPSLVAVAPPAAQTAAEKQWTPFVVLAGASGLPRFESGELIRIDIPESALPALGLWPPQSHGGAIQADVLVGQDGLARAVRLVQ